MTGSTRLLQTCPQFLRWTEGPAQLTLRETHTGDQAVTTWSLGPASSLPGGRQREAARGAGSYPPLLLLGSAARDTPAPLRAALFSGLTPEWLGV